MCVSVWFLFSCLCQKSIEDSVYLSLTVCLQLLVSTFPLPTLSFNLLSSPRAHRSSSDPRPLLADHLYTVSVYPTSHLVFVPAGLRTRWRRRNWGERSSKNKFGWYKSWHDDLHWMCGKTHSEKQLCRFIRSTCTRPSSILNWFFGERNWSTYHIPSSHHS